MLATPALLVWPDRIDANIRRMLQTAGRPDRLRPHCKTHKMAEVVRKLTAAGITCHKAATIVEADMLCRAGAEDVVLAGNPVGPALTELVRLAGRYPDVRFSVTADSEVCVRMLSDACQAAGRCVGVLLDLDVGLHRTGIDPSSDAAAALYRTIEKLPGIEPAGLHVYDGHQHQESLAERTNAVRSAWEPVQRLIERLEADGHTVPELLCGGTPTFPVYAEFSDPRIRLSPGTCTLHDVGYGSKCPDLEFEVAAAVATRVISTAVPGQLTLDAGHKSVAADPPASRRVFFPDLPDAQAIIHNEEHLTVTTSQAARFTPGDLLMALPIHICPTVALHHCALVVQDGRITDEWSIARHRRLQDGRCP